MSVFKPKHGLGQNFLKDSRVLDRIVSILDVQPEDTIVEIGPGHGELTRRILNLNPSKVISIEKDSELIDKFLNDLKKEYGSLEIVNADALKYILEIKGSYKLIGNIPYYITGQLLRVIEGLENKPKLISLTVQKEVAQRICAEPPKMNLLGATVQFWGKTELIRYISRKSFKPAPKVDSAVIKITPYSKTEVDRDQYYETVHALFKSSRKTISNNLKPFLTKEDLGKHGFNPKLRPQNLTIENIITLSNLFTRQEG